jgi:hypothetical protein
METAALVLLIIVSSVLAIFLVVLIVVAVYFVRVLQEVRRITSRAENVVGSVEAAAMAVGRSVSPLAVFRLIGGIVNHGSKSRKRRG